MRFMFKIAKHFPLQFLIAKMYGLLISYFKGVIFSTPEWCPIPLWLGLIFLSQVSSNQLSEKEVPAEQSLWDEPIHLHSSLSSAG